MQVKKFEAKTMKEALELVKVNLGPEAIILSAKEHQNGFGLMGSHSVEVTAAVSEQTLRKKQLAESKLTEKARENFLRHPAKMQKKFISKVYDSYQTENAPIKEITKRQYIDIDDEEELGFQHEPAIRSQAATYTQQTINQSVDAAFSYDSAKQRIKSATASALKAFENVKEEEPTKASVIVQSNQLENQRILQLQSEIRQLRSVIEGFQKIPQSFVGGHPGAEEGIPYKLSFMYEKLRKMGIAENSIIHLLRKAMKEIPKDSYEKKPLVDAWMIRQIMSEIHIQPGLEGAKYHLFVGPSGQGKTSALVKVASQMVIKEKKRVAIITSDLTKVGASEQLKIFARILNIPFAKLKKGSDWEVINARLSNVDYFLFDTPGLSLKSISELDYLRSLFPKIDGKQKIHYVQSVTANDQHAFEVAERYKVIGFDDVIFNRLDETERHGIIYNFMKKYEVPLLAFGIGSQIPEDFEYATRERVIDLLFKLSKVRRGEK